MSDHLLLRMHANRLALRALVLGEPAEARRHEQQAPRGDFGPAFRFLSRWGDFFTGLSYLWEGQVRLVEETLGPVVADAEASLGRRSPLTCMLATVLATALWELDRPQEAAALLANRLDVLERAGIPETLLLAYRTQARIAAADGGEHRALDLLESLHAAGVARRLPRLCVASLADQVRVHARRYRPETCRALCKQIDELLARDDLPQGRVVAPERRGLASARDRERGGRRAGLAARARGAPARRRARGRAEARPRADRDHGVAGVRARPQRRRRPAAAPRSDEPRRNLRPGAALRRRPSGARRLGAARRRRGGGPQIGARRPVPPPRGPVAAGRAPGRRARAVPSMVLTPKEREVLELLARNLSNKEIALAMEVGEETVKWHLKNLFGKLSASTRKHVVRRAQLLGLLEEAALSGLQPAVRCCPGEPPRQWGGSARRVLANLRNVEAAGCPEPRQRIDFRRPTGRR